MALRSNLSTSEIEMKYFLLSNLRMANAMVTIIFEISDATLIIRLSIRVLNALDVYLSS